MPHKVGKNRWKWGNVERSSKGELAKTVYGIWKKNGGKGDFGTFWRTGKTTESKSKNESLLHPMDFQLNDAIRDSYRSMYSRRGAVDEDGWGSAWSGIKDRMRDVRDRSVEMKDRIKDSIRNDERINALRDKADEYVGAIKDKAKLAGEVFSKEGWDGFKEGLDVGVRRTGSEVARGFERVGSEAARLIGKEELADDWDSKTDKFVDDTYERHDLGYEDALTDLGRVGGSIAGTALPMAAGVWAGNTALKGAGAAVRNYRDMKSISSLPKAPQLLKNAGAMAKSAPKALSNAVPKALPKAMPNPLPKAPVKPPLAAPSNASPYARLSDAEKAIIDKGQRLYAKAMEKEAADALRKFGTPWTRAKELFGKAAPIAAGTLGGAAAGYLAGKDGDDEGANAVNVDAKGSENIGND